MYTNPAGANNFAFIDGQNLHIGTTKRTISPWKVDLKHFRIYLEQKYNVSKAYYFLGYFDNSQEALYRKIQIAGFILAFRQHNHLMIGKKKGNVDSDIIFHIMKKLYYKEPFDKIILVSGDGDYRQLVDFLITESKFEKILFPEKDRASSLYKKLSSTYFSALDEIDIRRKIEMKKGP